MTRLTIEPSSPFNRSDSWCSETLVGLLSLFASPAVAMARAFSNTYVGIRADAAELTLPSIRRSAHRALGSNVVMGAPTRPASIAPLLLATSIRNNIQTIR